MNGNPGGIHPSKRSARALVGIVVTALLLSGGTSGAVARQNGDFERVSRLIADVAPHQGGVIHGRADDNGVRALIGDLEVSLPAAGDDALRLGSLSAPGPELTVHLPAEVTGARGEVASDGTVVYAGTDATAAVQILADGAVRIQTITEDAEGPHEFTYTFGEGIVPMANDGQVLLYTETNGLTQPVGVVAEPWAFDSDGQTVETWYEVRDLSLVQVIRPRADVSYPIIADPKLSRAWWNTTVHFNRAETAGLAGGAGAAAAVAAFIPDPTVSKIIAAAAGVAAAYISTVHANGGCIKAVMSGHVPPVVWQPYGGSEAGRYCR